MVENYLIKMLRNQGFNNTQISDFLSDDSMLEDLNFSKNLANRALKIIEEQIKLEARILS